MRFPRFLFQAILWLAMAGFFKAEGALPPASVRVPEPLKPWVDWATWGADRSPGTYQSAQRTSKMWPSELTLRADADGGRFSFMVEVYDEAWVPLPGGLAHWPQEVSLNGTDAPVVEHQGWPSLKAPAGSHKIEGRLRWGRVPQHLLIPPEVGVLSLTLNGKAVENTTWDARGQLWLGRDAMGDAEAKDFASWKVYRLLEDGVPMWLRTEVELTVAGKSRELEVGTILPQGWSLVSIEGPLPAVVDGSGKLKVQARAGKWTIHAAAVHFQKASQLGYAAGLKPAVVEELIALKTNPALRTIELVGGQALDASQTTFPAGWREFPLFRWSTQAPLRIEQKLVGATNAAVKGLTVRRELWLDEDGGGVTFRDQISGAMQRMWRLDSSPGQMLGAVSQGQKGQLLTENPVTGVIGVELRERSFDFEATGRIDSRGRMPASGWEADAESVRVSLNIPPGWRLLALFGADYVRGDWVMAWTLLDLFVLLLFSLGVYRLYGGKAGVLAFTALALSYHEAGAPKYAWLLLLVALALGTLARSKSAVRWLSALRMAAFLSLSVWLVPFMVAQIQQAIYPQLEDIGHQGTPEFSGSFAIGEVKDASTSRVAAPGRADAPVSESVVLGKQESLRSHQKKAQAAMSPAESENFGTDPKMRIQTGPPVPQWVWRRAEFGWNGPVSPSQTVQAVWLSGGMVRALTVVRLGVVCALVLLLLKSSEQRFAKLGRSAGALILFFVLLPSGVMAQFPDEKMLESLKARVLESSDAYPNAAEIANSSLTLNGRRLTVESEIHVAVRTSLPLPGRLPAWSPVSVLWNGKPGAVLRRADGFLWIVLPPGVHKVRVEGMLGEDSQWEWGFQLRPRRVSVQAPEWVVSGVSAEGVPEQQVLFVPKQKPGSVYSEYERQQFQPALLVERQLEFGLVWKIHNTVRRISPPGRAVEIRIPLLAGEKVLSQNAAASDGVMEIRMGAGQSILKWESEMQPAKQCTLASRKEDSWAEKWSLRLSPVWNVAFEGLPPAFEAGSTSLEPTWQPWPGESVRLEFTKPEAVPGPTLTISSVKHQTVLGRRQRTSTLEIQARSSLGEDLAVGLPRGAEVTSVSVGGREIPARVDDTRLLVPLNATNQTVRVEWRINGALEWREVVARIRLPVECANVDQRLVIGEDRWVLWTFGPTRGPSVRFWSVLACSLLAGAVLGRLRLSPLSSLEWMLLSIGLTQVPWPCAVLVVSWLFVLVWRGRQPFLRRSWLVYNFLQLVILALTLVALVVLGVIVGQGLLGNPDMFIQGNGSTRTQLSWYLARCDEALPQPGCVNVSIWWYKLSMLLWALWLASALLNWLRKGWEQFSAGDCFRRSPRLAPPPPPPR